MNETTKAPTTLIALPMRKRAPANLEPYLQKSSELRTGLSFQLHFRPFQLRQRIQDNVHVKLFGRIQTLRGSFNLQDQLAKNSGIFQRGQQTRGKRCWGGILFHQWWNLKLQLWRNPKRMFVGAQLCQLGRPREQPELQRIH